MFWEWFKDVVWGGLVWNLGRFSVAMKNLFTSQCGTTNPVIRKDVEPIVKDWENSAIKDFYEPAMKEIAKHSPLTPEEAKKHADFMTTIGQSWILSKNIVSLVAEISSFGQLEIPYWMIRSIAELYGVSDITRRCLTMPFDASTLIPLEYYYNKEFRPLIPSLVDLKRFYNKALISELDFYKYGSYHGQNDFWLSIHKLDTETPLAYFPLRMIADSGIYDVNLFEWSLTRMGYPKFIRDLLHHAFSITSKETQTGLTFANVKREWEIGKINDEELQNSLQYLGYSAEATKYYINLWKYEREFEGAKDSLTLLKKMHLDGQIDDTELIARMKDLKLPENYINTTLKYQHWKIETEKPKPTLNQLLDAFRHNIITEDYLRTEMTKMRYDPLDIEIIIQTHGAKFTPQFKDLPVATLVKAYHQNIIDKNELRTRLTALNYKKEDIDIIVALANLQTKLYTKPLSEADFEKAYKYGLIDENELYIRYSDAGYSSDDAILLVNIAIYEKEKLKVK